MLIGFQIFFPHPARNFHLHKQNSFIHYENYNHAFFKASHLLVIFGNTVDFRFKQDVVFQIHQHKRVANFSCFQIFRRRASVSEQVKVPLILLFI